MTWQQVRDVVDQIRQAQRRVHDALEHSRRGTQDPRTRALLDSVQQEGRQLNEILASYGAEGRHRLLDTWLQFVPDEDVHRMINTLDLPPNLSADDIVSRKLAFDQTLIALLRQLEENTALPKLQEFYHSLLEFLESRTLQQGWRVREYQADADPPVPQD